MVILKNGRGIRMVVNGLKTKEVQPFLVEGIHDVITQVRFGDDLLRGSCMGGCGVKVQHFPLTSLVVLTTLSDCLVSVCRCCLFV